MDETNKSFLNGKSEIKSEEIIKAYKRRWIILFLFMYLAAFNAFQWLEYSIITNIITKYYNVSSVAVDWTSMIYMAIYAIMVIPCSYVVERKGIRMASLIGGLGTLLGASIKIFSVNRNSFYIVIICQLILATVQPFLLILPTRLAAVWFKPEEASTACSLGLFGTLFGCALGFAIPPLLVKDHVNPEYIGKDLQLMIWGCAALLTPCVIAILIYFPKEPPKPPSLTQAEERSRNEHVTLKEFCKSTISLIRNKPFAIHVGSYGINIAVFCATSTLLNQFVLKYFPNAEEDAGRMGLVMMVVGMICSVGFGIVLDKTHVYKEMTVFIYFMEALSVAAMMFSLEMKSKLFVYIAITLFGIFSNAYMLVGFEFGVELTFPAPEATATGVLMSLSQVLGVVFTLIVAKLIAVIGPFWALGSQGVALLIGTIITAFIPNVLRRQNAFRDHKKHIEFDYLGANK